MLVDVNRKCLSVYTKNLRRHMAETYGLEMQHMAALKAVAAMMGYRDDNALVAALKTSGDAQEKQSAAAPAVPAAAHRPLDVNGLIEPLARYLRDPSITGLAMNRPCEVWLARKSGGFYRVADPALTRGYVDVLLTVLLVSERGGGEEMPRTLGVMLPGTSLRFSSFVDKAALSADICMNFSVTIRKLEYDAGASVSRVQWTMASQDSALHRRWALPVEGVEKIRESIEDGRGLVVVGPTMSGKTTLLRTVMSELDPGVRLFIADDAPELCPEPQRNAAYFVPPSSRGDISNRREWLMDAYRHAVCAIPDMIVAGEVSVENASFLMSAAGMGHQLLTTAHGTSYKDVLLSVRGNMQMMGTARGACDAHVDDMVRSALPTALVLDRDRRATLGALGGQQV